MLSLGCRYHLLTRSLGRVIARHDRVSSWCDLRRLQTLLPLGSTTISLDRSKGCPIERVLLARDIGRL